MAKHPDGGEWVVESITPDGHNHKADVPVIYVVLACGERRVQIGRAHV